MQLPDSRFLHSMGVASIIAGVILLALSVLVRKPRVRRAVRRAR